MVNEDMEGSEGGGECTPWETDKGDQLVMEFEDQSYELAQTYQLEEEYQDMMAEQEAAEVQKLTLWE